MFLARDQAIRTQKNNKAKRYDKIIVLRLFHFVKDHQHDWDVTVQHVANGLQYAGTLVRHHDTSSSLVQTRDLPRPTTVNNPSDLPTNTNNETNPKPLCAKLLNSVRALRSRVKTL